MAGRASFCRTRQSTDFQTIPLVEEKVDPAAPAVGQAVRDLGLPAECVLTAVIREGQLIIPRGDTVLQASDEVLAVVHAEQLTQLGALLGPPAMSARLNC
ncbi:MAG: hypothetical protein KKA73_14015 [Chloroflexi bacterium]|nr:hypothetical protein [Chloroflexota bacterium]MBU1748800.1 hypothetical protein [Chloroflexota bacterium]